MDKFKLLDQLSNSKGYDIALFTTFNFDIAFFDRAIARPLIDKGIKKISVFVDQSELNKSIIDINSSDLGKKYVLNPIELKGKAFHPKLVLLLGKSSAKLYVASANITVSGYCINHEVVNCFEYVEGKIDNIGIIKTAIDFFISLHNSSYKQDEGLIDEIKRLPYYKVNVKDYGAELIHNLELPILAQVSERVSNVEKISIAVPYYDNELMALKEITDTYPNAEITLYLQNMKSRIDINSVNNNVTVFPYSEITKNPNFYHGKVLCFTGEEREYILYGSANCTKSALLSTPDKGGNIECSVLVKGAKGEFGYFFDSFDRCEDEEVSFVPLTYENKTDSNFYFRYGLLTDSLTLVYGYRKYSESPVVKFKEETLPYSCSNNDLVITIPYDIISEEDNILDITFEYNEKTEVVKSWYNDNSLISFNRAKSKNGSVFNFKLGSDGSEFINDRRELLSWTAITLEELLDEQQVYSTVNQNNTEPDEPESDSESEEGIISYTIPTSEMYDRYEKYVYAKRCSALLIDSYFGRAGSEQPSDKDNVIGTIPTKRTFPTQSEQDNFTRFVKLRVNSMFIPEFVKKVSFERYWAGAHIFFNIFDKRDEDTNKNVLFTNEYIALTKAKLIESLFCFDIEEKYAEDMKAIVYRSFAESFFLVDMYSEKNALIKDIYRRAIRKLNEFYDMRDSFKDYITEASPFMPRRVKSQELVGIIKYADSLFGYIPLERIFEIIRKTHGEDCTYELIGGKITVKFGTTCIRQFMNPGALTKYLLPLAEYAKEKGGISEAEVYVNNLGIYEKHINYATLIIYKVNLLKKSYTKELLRHHGTWDNVEKGRL